MRAIDGGDVRAGYVKEDNGFRNDPSDTAPKVPGKDAQFTTAEATNNGERIHLPASRTAVAIEAGSFDGSWAWQFSLSNPWFLTPMLGEPSESGTGPYTYTWADGADPEPVPMQMFIGQVPNSVERVFEGCLPVRCQVNPTTDQATATVTMEGLYATEAEASSITLDSQPDQGFDTLGYKDATLDLDSTAQAIMQSATWLMEYPNLQAITGFDSRFAVGYEVNNFEADCSYDAVTLDDTHRSNFYGDGSTSMQEDVADDRALEHGYDDGTTTLTFTGSGGFPQSFDEPTGDPTSRVEASLQYLLQDVSVEAVTEVQAPA